MTKPPYGGPSENAIVLGGNRAGSTPTKESGMAAEEGLEPLGFLKESVMAAEEGLEPLGFLKESVMAAMKDWSHWDFNQFRTSIDILNQERRRPPRIRRNLYSINNGAGKMI